MMCTSHSVMEGQRHNNPLTRVAFVYNGSCSLDLLTPRRSPSSTLQLHTQLPEGPLGGLPSLSLTTEGSWIHLRGEGRQTSCQATDASTPVRVVVCSQCQHRQTDRQTDRQPVSEWLGDHRQAVEMSSTIHTHTHTRTPSTSTSTSCSEY